MQITIANVYATPDATLPNTLIIIKKTLCNISIGKPVLIIGYLMLTCVKVVIEQIH